MYMLNINAICVNTNLFGNMFTIWTLYTYRWMSCVHNLLLLPIHIARPCDPSVLYLFSGCHNYFDHCKATKYTVSVVIWFASSVCWEEHRVSWFYVNDSEAICFLWDILLLILNNVWLWIYCAWIIDVQKWLVLTTQIPLFLCIQ